MANRLNVQNIYASDAQSTPSITIDSSGISAGTLGSGVTFPAGHIVQTKFVYFDGIQTIGNGSTTGTTFTTIGSGVAGKEFSIPMSISQGNVIFGMGNVNMSANARYSALKIFADSTQIAMGLASSLRTQVTSANSYDSGVTSNQYIMYQSNFSFTYTPADTSIVTYTVKAANTNNAAYYTYINRSQTDSDSAWAHRGYSHLILMEISQ